MLKGAAKAISLVLLDLRMPLVDGVDTLKRLKPFTASRSSLSPATGRRKTPKDPADRRQRLYSQTL